MNPLQQAFHFFAFLYFFYCILLSFALCLFCYFFCPLSTWLFHLGNQAWTKDKISRSTKVSGPVWRGCYFCSYFLSGFIRRLKRKLSLILIIIALSRAIRKIVIFYKHATGIWLISFTFQWLSLLASRSRTESGYSLNFLNFLKHV